MSWRDRLQPGSFRAVPFKLRGHDSSFGRRQVIYEFPDKDEAFSEDLGRKARRIRIDAVILGDSYDAERDLLISALEREGPGKLVHPHLGEMTVVIEGEAQIRESADNGGMCEISFTAVQVGLLAQPQVVIDPRAAAESAARIALEALGDDFEVSFSVANAPAFVQDAGLSDFDTLLQDLSQLRGDVGAIADLPNSVAADIQRISTDLVTLIGTPARLANNIIALIATTINSVTRVVGAIGSLLSVVDQSRALGADLVAPNLTALSRRIQARNQAAAKRLVRAAALISAASVAAGATYDSGEDADAVKSTLLDGLDAISDEDGISDALYSSVRDLAAQVRVSLTQAAAAAPRRVDYTPGETLPVLVVAHLLYGDATREAEITARNKLRDPGAIPGGLPIEVLSK